MPKLSIDADLIRELAALLDETGLNEIEVADGTRHVRVGRAGDAAAGRPPLPASAPIPAPPPAPSLPHAPPAGAVTSPMVGTVYLAAELGAPPFIKAGDTVAEGQTLVVVEAMKVMNPIKAPRAGRVSEIRVANGSPVEYGEVLVVLG